MRFLLLYIPLGLLISCSGNNTATEKNSLPPEQSYVAFISSQGQKIPFEFELHHQGDSAFNLALINGREQIVLDAIESRGDSFRIPMHIFDTEITATYENGRWSGYWQKNYVSNYRLPFEAYPKGREREPDSGFQLAPRYKVNFETDSLPAVALFEQKGNELTGTFLTHTGDYRFLTGEVYGDSLWLSTFDGEHAFLFKANAQNDSSLKGEFWSGKDWHENWEAQANDSVEISNPEQLNFLREGYEQFEFSAINLDSDSVSYSSVKDSSKALLIQIMGSWCPNCMDETRFLSKWYRERKPEGVELIALAFERKNDFDYAGKQLRRLKKHFNITYPLYFAGDYHKEAASRALPALNRVIAYPTLVFIDQNGEVQRIHTGFQGPGTGKTYERWILHFNAAVDKLINDPS